MILFPRFARLPVLLFAALGTAAALPAQDAPAPITVDRTAWLYKGSDITPDPAWRFGTLPNGVRYAVRKNGVPPGQVAIRVRIDAGALNEADSERGFAHLIEHLSFRGSANVPDGEAKRRWQRMGATFGADTNASTSFTQTVYKLDLPSVTEANLDESLGMLADMMGHASLAQTALDAERPVVLAEAREQPGPQRRMSDLVRQTFFAGQPFAERPPIGTPEALGAATAASVRAFHDRWYRPERTLVVIAGDFDPATFERLVAQHFGAWRAAEPATPTPDFGRPKPGPAVTAALVEPALPPVIQLGWLRPWSVTNDTVIFNQKRMIDQIAVRIVNRRLETRARAGGSFITASADLDDIARSANATTVSILPVGEDWQAALKDVRTAIAAAIAVPPTKAEIAREVGEIDAGMRASVAAAGVEAGAKQADDLVMAVDIHETVATAQTNLDIFRAAVKADMFTPAAVQASAKAVFSAPAERAVLNTRTADPGAAAALQAALAADVKGAAGARDRARRVRFAALPHARGKATITERATVLNDPKVEQVMFANGVKLLLFSNPSEVSRVYVRVRFGRGLADLPARATPAFAAELALVASGVGKYGQEELDRLIGGRQIGFDFGIDDDAFVLGGTTTAADLKDQLALLAAKLTGPAWNSQPVVRARAVMLTTYASLDASPDAVIGRDLDRLLHDGDPRWGSPDRAAIEALTPQSFRQLWEPLLAAGPIEVQVFGDVPADQAVRAVSDTFGTLAPRRPTGQQIAIAGFPAHVATPVVRTHSGNPAQAAAVIAWPAGSGIEGIGVGRKLDILAAIFRDRLYDRLRTGAGISYTPNVQASWPTGSVDIGRVMAIGLVPPDRTGTFFQMAREIAADLAARPVDPDELRRAVAPTAQLIARLASGNTFWLQQTEGATLDKRRLAAIDTLASDIVRTTPAEVQQLAARYLVPSRDWTMVVVPESLAAGAAAAALPPPAPPTPAVIPAKPAPRTAPTRVPTTPKPSAARGTRQ